MTETTPVPTPAPTKRRPFEALRVDAKKAVDGVWIEHPESKDRLRVRRLWCAEHLRAYEQAAQDYDVKHGAGKSETGDGQRYVDAVALATGLIVDWQLEGNGERPYDAAEMTAVLQDPDFADLRAWVRVAASQRTRFRTEHVAGN